MKGLLFAALALALPAAAEERTHDEVPDLPRSEVQMRRAI